VTVGTISSGQLEIMRSRIGCQPLCGFSSGREAGKRNEQEGKVADRRA
jgi:hypothetical protein